MTKRDHQDEATGRMIGYARVSTKEQNLDMQRKSLERAGVEPKMIFSESASGMRKGRPALRDALRAAGAGDTLVVWKLDRLSRESIGLLVMLEELAARGVKVRSLTETFDMESASGRFLTRILAASAEFEREVIVERTRAGVANAQANDVQFGAREEFSDATIAKAWKRVHIGKMVRGVRVKETRVAVADDIGITTQHMARRFKRYERDFASDVAELRKVAARQDAKKTAGKRRAKRT